MNNSKVILCAYNWAGCKALRILLDLGYDVFVYTSESPDYVNSLTAYCKDLEIPFSTSKINIDNIPFKPAFIASIFYRHIIPNSVIQLTGNKIFNLHPSLLPYYRGCSSLTWAMINGEKTCGYTYHYIDEGIDTGNILLQKEIEIEEFDTQITLYHRVMFEALKDFQKVISLVLEDYKGYSQDSKKGSYYKRGCPFDGKISNEWETSFKKRFVRAMIYPPLPPATYDNDEIAQLKNFY